MKIRLKEASNRTAIEIDPVMAINKNFFAPLIAVTDFKNNEDGPVIVSTYAGHMKPEEARTYAAALDAAAKLCELSKKSGLASALRSYKRDLFVTNRHKNGVNIFFLASCINSSRNS